MTLPSNNTRSIMFVVSIQYSKLAKYLATMVFGRKLEVCRAAGQAN